MDRKEFLETIAGAALASSITSIVSAKPAPPPQTGQSAGDAPPWGGPPRIPFFDFICDDGFANFSANGNVLGYTVRIRLNRYRSLPLSGVTELQLKIDGQVVNPMDIAFRLNDKEFMISQLKDLYNEYWNCLDKAELQVRRPGGLSAGEHQVDLTLKMRIPYITLPWTYGSQPHTYQIQNNSQSRKIKLQA